MKSKAAPPENLKLCKFEELKGEFTIRREIGRGTNSNLLTLSIGSYGVVFKAIKNDKNDVDANNKLK